MPTKHAKNVARIGTDSNHGWRRKNDSSIALEVADSTSNVESLDLGEARGRGAASDVGGDAVEDRQSFSDRPLVATATWWNSPIQLGDVALGQRDDDEREDENSDPDGDEHPDDDDDDDDEEFDEDDEDDDDDDEDDSDDLPADVAVIVTG